MSFDLSELKKLSREEKLKIVQELWDDIAASNEPLPLAQWQIDESLRRRDELKADPSIAIDEEELWRRVKGEK